MTIVILGVDALDPDLVDRDRHPNLTLSNHKSIETIVSSAGEPSTHELWPTIITGLTPDEHGIKLDDGVAWENSAIRYASRFADFLLPDSIQSKIGAWLLDNTETDAFRMPATYYRRNGISTMFDDTASRAIGVPNYVTDRDEYDHEHLLRLDMGELFERDQSAPGGHRSADPAEFYEQCMEMAMVRIARVRRALRSHDYELVFGYTSALDLIGHVSYDRPDLQRRAYDEADEFVAELASDLDATDELVLLSDHGLQDGLHTEQAMVAATDPGILERIDSVVDVRDAVEYELERRDHVPETDDHAATGVSDQGNRVKEQLEDLGYL